MDNILATIGKTPLLGLGSSVPADAAKVYAKLEMFNPGGSIKDRICLHMIEAAEASGELQPGDTVIEPTSGNTGIGLALVCGVKKYPLILVMPENYSKERRFMMQAMGAKIVLTSAEDEMPGAIAKTQELAAELPRVFLPQQFKNPQNSQAHRENTAPEIFADLPPEQIDAFVVGVGTGGTLMGIGSELRRLNPACKIVAVEPRQAAVLSGGPPAIHKIQGIGPGFIPDILDTSIIDQIELIDDDEAYRAIKELSRQEGILVGISSGAAFVASRRVAKALGTDKTVLTVFPDKGERYFSIEKYFASASASLH